MSGTLIKTIHARQVYTNRGNPGVEATVVCENGATGVAMCTSGISVGTHEVRFNFDGGTKFNGKGVMGADWEAYFNEYCAKLEAAGGQKVIDTLQAQVDAFLAAK